MVYHSNFNEVEARNISGLSILPIKSKVKGNAPVAPPDQEDIIDESLNYFKANVLFRNFEVKGPADRLLIYISLYINKLLTKCAGKNKGDADKLFYQAAIENFTLPGDKDFPLGGLVTAPKTKADADFLRQYFTQVRQETGVRLLERLYGKDPSKPNKWWMCFSKRKFLNKTL
eukprot:TRINITY_DN6604_c0_g1_i1.p1 TRINITY_DN6604_c0_g1~~TRINITY_DN6604_c0_g1_i1.p1  ORF type:complete len:173 (+),score=41.09 TRINITY_DN6604_c0_g1_i1:140-658(+)